MYGASNIVFIVFAGLAAVLTAVPLPKAIASGNLGTSMLIAWTELACLLTFANAIRWNQNIDDWAPAWCDFCAHFLIAVDVALVGSGVSINRRLYMIVTLDPRRHEKAFNAVVDAILCILIPLVSIALEYVVQQYRYYIYEDVGCLPGVASVALSFPLVWMLPLCMGVVSAVYAFLNIRASLQRSHKVVDESGTNMAWSRRLMAIGVVSALYGFVPTTAAIVLLALGFPVTPWPGWDALHATMGEVAYVPALEWQVSTVTIASVELRRWTVVSLAFIIFLFLGLTADVKKMYRVLFRGVNTAFSAAGSSRTVLGTDENLITDHRHHNGAASSHGRSAFSFAMPRSEKAPESFSMSDRSRSHADLESSQISQPSFVTCPASPWEPHDEESGCPAYGYAL